MIENYLSDICDAFGISSKGEPFGSGHINDTYTAEIDGVPYVLQRINTDVFKSPENVMENILNVTVHLKQKLEACGEDSERGTLCFLKTTDGKPYFKDADGDCFRAYRFIDDSVTFDAISDTSQFFEAARAFGHFQNMLSDFPAEKLHETIQKFHDTPNRIAQLKEAIEKNISGRLNDCRNEVSYALSQENDADKVCRALDNGTIPYRVTHNDTKLNNVLFDTKTGKGICVIDLDTVMPGSLLYDFGDALRFGANSAAEDETDLDKVSFDLELFEAFTKGFASEMKNSITDAEKELLAFSAKLITYECGIRFLTDFINGDTYFKTSYATHNLDRARNQFKLCRDIDCKRSEMERIVKENF